MVAALAPPSERAADRCAPGIPGRAAHRSKLATTIGLSQAQPLPAGPHVAAAAGRFPAAVGRPFQREDRKRGIGHRLSADRCH